MATFQFNASEVEPEQGFSVVPAGMYAAQIIDVEIKDTKAGNGQYMSVTWELLDGQYRGRKVWSRLTVRNANAEAERIGRQQLSALCHAVGVLNLQDTVQLHGKQARLRVTVKQDAQYGDSNDVKGYEALAGSAPGAPFTPPPAAAPARAGKPW